MDSEILASDGRRRRGSFEDFGAALSGDGETGARVEANREIDVIAGYEAAAIGEEEEEGYGCWQVRRSWHWLVRGCIGRDFVWNGRNEFQRISVGKE